MVGTLTRPTQGMGPSEEIFQDRGWGLLSALLGQSEFPAYWETGNMEL